MAKGKGKGKGKEHAPHVHNPHPSSSRGFQKYNNLNNDKKDPPVKVVLSDMPDYDIIKVYVDSEYGAAKAFREAIGHLRAKASEKKAVFNDIPCIGIVDDRGFPLMELQAVLERESVQVSGKEAILERESDQVSGRVLISKNDFYVVAFYQCDDWLQLKGIDYEILMDNNKPYETFDFSGNYGESKPWESIGPVSVIQAINSFNQPRASEKEIIKACRAFFVHFCESSRLRLIEEIVCMSFGPLGKLQFDEVEDDEVYNALKAECHIDGTYVYGNRGEMDSISSVFGYSLNNYLAELIRGWGQISQWWIAYSLRQGTSGERIEGLTELDSTFKMKYVRTVKASLGVLCRPNKGKIISGLKGKVTPKELFEI